MITCGYLGQKECPRCVSGKLVANRTTQFNNPPYSIICDSCGFKAIAFISSALLGCIEKANDFNMGKLCLRELYDTLNTNSHQIGFNTNVVKDTSLIRTSSGNGTSILETLLALCRLDVRYVMKKFTFNIGRLISFGKHLGTSVSLKDVIHKKNQMTLHSRLAKSLRSVTSSYWDRPSSVKLFDENDWRNTSQLMKLEIQLWKRNFTG